jgi:hypothetical protein
MHTPGKRVGYDRPGKWQFYYYRLITLQVTPDNPANRSHPL